VARKPATLRPHQTMSLEWMVGRSRFNLFAGMGTGKTLTMLTWIQRNSWDLLSPVLIIAPTRVAKHVWPEEAEAWEHLEGMSVTPVLGTPLQRLKALNSGARIFSINYENIPWLIETAGAFWPFQTVIADESTRLKGFRTRQGTARAKALAKVAHAQVDRWVNLCGLPAPNGLVDLWGQHWFVDKGVALGRTFSDFQLRWFARPPQGGQFTPMIPMRHAQEEIEQRMKSDTLAIRPEDWFTLEEPVVTDIWVDLPPTARKQYKTMAREFFVALEGGTVTAVNAAVKSGKLIQMANGALYTEGGSAWETIHDAKIDALASILAEAQGAPVLCVYNFRHDLARIKKAFPAARVIGEDDPGAIAAWNNGEVPLLLAHPKSAGHGLNLQHGGNILAYFGQDWNLEDHEQILERIGPMRQMQSGYHRPVFVYHIMARDTIDTAVRMRRGHKMSVVDCLMEAFRSKENDNERAVIK
jgi:SNF2 family DNA or RNA helicase